MCRVDGVLMSGQHGMTLADMASAAVAGPQASSLGTAVYLMASLFNHSCTPNVEVTFPKNNSQYSHLCSLQHCCCQMTIIFVCTHFRPCVPRKPCLARLLCDSICCWQATVEAQCRALTVLLLGAGTAEFVAARDIACGEQLNISYIDASMNGALRQKQLEWAYGFKCKCALCTEELIT